MVALIAMLSPNISRLLKWCLSVVDDIAFNYRMASQTRQLPRDLLSCPTLIAVYDGAQSRRHVNKKPFLFC